MESDLNSHQQNGTPKDNLIAGLAYSIVHNYLNRVVRDKPVGNKIFFQGGVTNNKAVLAAFEEVTGKPIHVPPHFDITGAIGAAILARQSMNGEASRFKGFEVSKTYYRYQDGYLQENFTTDESGLYSYNQDISNSHQRSICPRRRLRMYLYHQHYLQGKIREY